MIRSILLVLLFTVPMSFVASGGTSVLCCVTIDCSTPQDDKVWPTVGGDHVVIGTYSPDPLGEDVFVDLIQNGVVVSTTKADPNEVKCGTYVATLKNVAAGKYDVKVRVGTNTASKTVKNVTVK